MTAATTTPMTGTMLALDLGKFKGDPRADDRPAVGPAAAEEPPQRRVV